MGGGPNFKIPDYRSYKVDGIKELEWVRDSLASKGLKDPWLRNEVWRYQHWPGFGKSAIQSTFKGFKYAAVLMAVTIAADQVLGFSKHGHDDHH